MRFSQKMSLYFFYTMVQKSKKWPKTQIKGGGSCLNGAFVNTSWDRSTRHRAHPKRNALGGKVLAGTFCRTWRENLCHFTHQFVSCSFLFRAMENPPTSAALAELDSDPDSPHLDQFPPGQQRSSLGLYHSLHNHLRHPDDRRTTWKEGRRVDLDLALGYSPEQGNG